MRRALITLVRLLPLLVAAVILLVLVLTVPAFHRPRYWVFLAVQNLPAVALALALAPVVITGGIDLSVGATMVLASVVGGLLWEAGLSPWLALLLGTLAGGACGLLNGAMVVAGVVPLVVTLATRELFRGVAMTLSQGRRVQLFDVAGQGVLSERVLGLPWAVWALAALAIVAYIMVHHTWLGRALFALGDNERAARFAGVPVARVQLGLYAATGLVAGLCGGALVLRFGVADAEAERSVELLAIACVVMGGVRVTGGAGHVGGVVVGAVTVCALLAGLGNVASDWRDTVAGAVLIGMALTTEAAARWLEKQPR